MKMVSSKKHKDMKLSVTEILPWIGRVQCGCDGNICERESGAFMHRKCTAAIGGWTSAPWASATAVVEGKWEDMCSGLWGW